MISQKLNDEAGLQNLKNPDGFNMAKSEYQPKRRLIVWRIFLLSNPPLFILGSQTGQTTSSTFRRRETDEKVLSPSFLLPSIRFQSFSGDNVSTSVEK
ncbi:hypothetical protein GE061_006027 [Apolygus lucorum]|uniref:Uncharacterized protein n=1 Tax=Apolygus lucorum TaxID=248454 RepID=A0A8S9WU51_APOLU|nr:hypothetical protein GE061_006027 [Apolygus lucorum]